MARYLPAAVAMVGYLMIAAGALLIDWRLGLAVVGILAVIEAREASE